MSGSLMWFMIGVACGSILNGAVTMFVFWRGLNDGEKIADEIRSKK